ncbi:MAG: hypothetical protein ACXVDK_13400, partial [Bacteroidia bacterium]
MPCTAGHFLFISTFNSVFLHQVKRLNMIKKLAAALIFCSAIGFAQSGKSIKGMSHSIEAPGFPHTLAAAKTASAS